MTAAIVDQGTRRPVIPSSLDVSAVLYSDGDRYASTSRGFALGQLWARLAEVTS